MGNALAAPAAVLPAPSDALADLPEGVVFKAALGGGRFLKTARKAAPDARAWRAQPRPRRCSAACTPEARAAAARRCH